MTIIGMDGCQVVLRMPMYEYKKLVKALASMDDDDSEEN